MQTDRRKYTTDITVIFAVYLLNCRFWPFTSYIIPVTFDDDGGLCFPLMRPTAAACSPSLGASLPRNHSVNISGVFVM
jgi:hypothetical protein